MTTTKLIAADREVILPKKKIKKLMSDAVSSAEAVNLVYVNGNQPGITRMEHGKGVANFLGIRKIKRSKDL